MIYYEPNDDSVALSGIRADYDLTLSYDETSNAQLKGHELLGIIETIFDKSRVVFYIVLNTQC